MGVPLQQILLVIHLLIAIALVVVVLLQRSEGGGLGIGGGGGMMSTRGQANLLTRATAVLAAAFMGMSLLLAILASGGSQPSVLVDEAPLTTESAPAPEENVPQIPTD
jgi:preprotein translocase subunit SecG